MIAYNSREKVSEERKQEGEVKRDLRYHDKSIHCHAPLSQAGS